MKTRRDYYRPIIAEILDRHDYQETAECRRELREAFPHPPLQYHPYKIWRHEIAVQMGRKRFGKGKHPQPAGPAECAGQLHLFGEERNDAV